MNRIRRKIAERKTLKNIVDSKAVVFTKGSVSATLDVIRTRPLCGAFFFFENILKST